jgi:hypothetical protein
VSIAFEMVFRRRQGPLLRPLLLYRLKLIERKTLNRPSNKASVPRRFMVLAFFLVFRTLRPCALRHVLSSTSIPAAAAVAPAKARTAHGERVGVQHSTRVCPTFDEAGPAPGLPTPRQGAQALARRRRGESRRQGLNDIPIEVCRQQRGIVGKNNSFIPSCCREVGLGKD